jgi:hypothetical protein
VKKNRYSKKHDELFRAIGEFVFLFSHLEHSVRWALASALKLHWNMIDAVTSSYDFATLCRVTSRVLALAEDEEAKKEEIARIFNACLAMNNERVRIVHGIWPLFGGGARHVSRQTLKERVYFKETDEIVEKTREIEKLVNSVDELGNGWDGAQLPQRP